MGMYIGGPGEQDYGNPEGDNGSLHSRVNHPSALSVKVSDDGYTDIGEGVAFNDFFRKIKEVNSNAYNKDAPCSRWLLRSLISPTNPLSGNW